MKVANRYVGGARARCASRLQGLSIALMRATAPTAQSTMRHRKNKENRPLKAVAASVENPSCEAFIANEQNEASASKPDALLSPERFMRWRQEHLLCNDRLMARFIDEERHRARISGDKTWTPNIYCTDAGLGAACAKADAHAGEENPIVNRLQFDVADHIWHAALAWQATKYVARFDADIYAAVANTPFEAHLPASVFARLPGYSVFIETPGFTPGAAPALADDPSLARFRHLDLDMLDVFAVMPGNLAEPCNVTVDSDPYRANGGGVRMDGFFATLTARSFGGPRVTPLPTLMLACVNECGMHGAASVLPLAETLEEAARELARKSLRQLVDAIQLTANFDPRGPIGFVETFEMGYREIFEPRLRALTGTEEAPLASQLTSDEFLGCVRAEPGPVDTDEVLDCLTALHMRDLQRFAPLYSLVLYLCSKEPDFDDGRGFMMPPAIKTVGNRAVSKVAVSPTARTLGARMGAAFRVARAEARSSAGGFYATEDSGAATGSGSSRHKIPHVRSAHWHSFWTGPRKSAGEQKPVVHWIPPTLVNVPMGGEIQAVIRPVRAPGESRHARAAGASPRSASAA